MEEYKMKPGLLKKAISRDLKHGFRPLCIIATIGTTSTTAIDPLEEIAQISSEYKIWLHVDAALAGSALILPEFRWMINGVDKADSFVFNPHKWLFTNFDCSAYFVRNAESLINTLEILPEYLKTQSRGQVNDYRDWGVPLGRRFRALKLWFVIRNFGLKGLQKKLRNHLQLSQQLKEKIIKSDDFEIMAPVPLNTICFRYHPSGTNDLARLDKMNEKLMHQLNESGKAYFTHTRLNGIYVIRFVIGQTNVTEKHIINAWELIKQTANKLNN